MMEKTAQRRGVLQKLHEWGNVDGRMAERFFSPELKRVMDNLRANDDQIRANVVGEPIAKAKPIPGAAPLKDLLKSAKSNLNRREYMSAVSDLSRFHKQVEEVAKSIKDIDRNVDKVHDEFLYNGLGDEQKKHLLEMRERFGPKAASAEDELVKEAGLAEIGDFLRNIGTRRGRALAMWEKRYPKAAEQLKKDTRSLVEEAGSVLDVILSSLKVMGTARASRNVDEYVVAAHEIKKKCESYDKLFRIVYARSYEKFIHLMHEQQAPAKTVEDATELGKQEVSTGVPPMGSGFVSVPKSEFSTSTPPASSAPATETPPATEQTSTNPVLDTLDKLERMQNQAVQPAAPATPAKPVGVAPTPLKVQVGPEPAPPLPPGVPIPPGVTAHRKFYNSLEKLSNEDPRILASYIKKYANSIKSTDPETAVQLLSIVNSIKG
jgi:hypothetical protein